MILTVLLFAAAKEAAQTAAVILTLPVNATVADLRSGLVSAVPALQPLQHALLIAVNNQYAADTLGLSETDEVACFPPVSGG